VLKSAKPLPVGKKIKCPSCGGAIPIKEANGAPAKGKEEAVKKPAAAPGKPRFDDEDDEGGDSYVLRKDEEEEEGRSSRKPVDVMPKELPKRKKFEAESIVQTPATFLFWTGVLGVAAGLLVMVYFLFPVCFSKSLSDPAEVLKPPASQTGGVGGGGKKSYAWEELNAEEKEKVKEADRPLFWQYMGGASIGLVVAIYAMFVCNGAVKMQFVESYNWAMAGAIMGILILPLTAVWALMTLRNPTVIAGFKEARRRKVV